MVIRKFCPDTDFCLLDIGLLISLTLNTASFQIMEIHTHTHKEPLLFSSPFIKWAYWFYLLYVDCFFCGARNTSTSQLSHFCCVLAEEIILILVILF